MAEKKETTCLGFILVMLTLVLAGCGGGAPSTRAGSAGNSQSNPIAVSSSIPTTAITPANNNTSTSTGDRAPEQKAVGHGGPTPVPTVTPPIYTLAALIQSGKTTYQMNCFTCHGDPKQNANSVLFGTNPMTLKNFQQQPGSVPAGMFAALQPLTNQDLDNIALYLESQDINIYTVRGKVLTNQPVLPVNGARVRILTKYLAGENAYYSPVVDFTENDGSFELHCSAGRKDLIVDMPGHTFTPDQIAIDLNFYVPQDGKLPNGSTGSQGPNGPLISGETFFTDTILVTLPPYPIIVK